MPTEVLKDAFVNINGVDLSDHVKTSKVTYSVELQDASAMGNVAKARKPGLFDAGGEFELYQDYDAAKVDATIFPIVGVQVPIRVRKSKTDAISATNPEYQWNGIVESYPPLGGGVGEMHMTTITIPASDGVKLIRDTTP
jgi:hypothetical protein